MLLPPKKSPSARTPCQLSDLLSFFLKYSLCAPESLLPVCSAIPFHVSSCLAVGPSTMSQVKITSFFSKVRQPSPNAPTSDKPNDEIVVEENDLNTLNKDRAPVERDTAVARDIKLNCAAMSKMILSKMNQPKIESCENMEVDESISEKESWPVYERKTRTSSRRAEAKQFIEQNVDSVFASQSVSDQSNESEDSSSNRSLRRSARNRTKSFKLTESEIDKESKETVVTRKKSTKKSTGSAAELIIKSKGKAVTKISNKKKVPVITIKDSPPCNKDYDPTPLPSHEFLKLWTQTYQPKTVSDLVGHSREIDVAKEWLTSWQETFNSSGNDSDNEDDDIVDGKCLLICGPSGVGKTSLVYSIASDLNYKVLEYNATSQRLSPAVIQKELSESLQSHYINQVSMANLFRPNSSIKKTGKGRKKTVKPVESKVESNVKLSKSLILIDDLDGIIYENTSYSFAEVWRSLKHVIINARKPIAITSSIDSTFLCNESQSHYFRTIFLSPLSSLPLSSHLNRIFKAEFSKDISEFSHYAHIDFTGDARKLLNQAQFWQYGSFGETEAAYGREADNADDMVDLLGDTYENHVALLDFLSVEDIVTTAMKHNWLQSSESYESYNRHLFDHRLSFDINAEQSDQICLHLSQHADLLSRQQSVTQNDHFDESLRQFIRNTYAQQASEQGSHFADFHVFFSDLSVSRPDLVEKLQFGAPSTGAMTRSKRSFKSSSLLFM